MLDGAIQCTERDKFGYQEMISQIPLCSHPNPERVLIVGGGDGGVSREVIKHPAVKEVIQVEIDDRVVYLSKKYLPCKASGFDSPKVRLVIGDGLQILKKFTEYFDVIITDSSDPIGKLFELHLSLTKTIFETGPAKSLFQDSYFESMKKALKPGGVFCLQGSNFWIDLKYVQETFNTCGRYIKNIRYATIMVPSYPCGSIGFIIGCLDENRKLGKPIHRYSCRDIEDLDFKYYTSEIHRAAFALPRFAEKALRNDHFNNI